MEISLHSRNTFLYSRHGPHTKLMLFFFSTSPTCVTTISAFCGRKLLAFCLSYSGIPFLQLPSLSDSSSICISQLRLRLHTDHYRGTWHTWEGNDLFWRHMDQSPDVTGEDFPLLLGAGVPCVWINTGVPRGTPVFDTATLSQLVSSHCWVTIVIFHWQSATKSVTIVKRCHDNQITLRGER